MKLYTYREYSTSGGYIYETLVFGSLQLKKVDKFNEKIKVFVPIGKIDKGSKKPYRRTDWTKFKVDFIQISDLEQRRDWNYPANIVDLRPLDKNELKSVQAAALTQSKFLVKFLGETEDE